jgi:hypothetical protein
MEIEGDGEHLPMPAGASLVDNDGDALPDINFDDGKFNRHPKACRMLTLCRGSNESPSPRQG